jgi:NADP-dependent 3-hydroxy acid dehydrogenase YdfG
MAFAGGARAAGRTHSNREETIVSDGSQVRLVTGASAGVGRATVREFAKRGARIGLIARGRAGLEGARRDVQPAAGQALVLPLDVSDADQEEG